MVLNDAVQKDLTNSSQLLTAASPKILYTSFLLGLIREYFSLIMGPEVKGEQIERGFMTLIAFAPDADARKRIEDRYNFLRRKGGDGGNGIPMEHAAIMCTGLLVDYLSACMDLTESAEGGFL